jgi:hypothetical protein
MKQPQKVKLSGGKPKKGMKINSFIYDVVRFALSLKPREQRFLWLELQIIADQQLG